MTEKVKDPAIDSHKSFNFNNFHMMFMFVAFIGIFLGTVILLVGNLPIKWVFILVVMGCFPLFVIAIGSLERALQALLIFSLSMAMDLNPWWSARYAILKPGMPITLTSIILFALYSLWVMRLLSKKASVRLFPSATIPFALIVLWSGLSFLVATDPAYVLASFPSALAAFLLFIYAANFIKSQKDIRFTIKTIAITVLFCGILGISQHLAGTDFNLSFLGARDVQSVMDYPGVNISRVSGFLGQPNNFAHFLIGLLPFLLVCTLSVTGLSLRGLCFVSFTLGLMSLVLTFSRGGWLAFLTSLLIIAVFSFRKQLHKKFPGSLVRLIVIGFVGMVLITPYFSRMAIRITKDDYGAAYSRIPLAKTALKIIKKKPMAGVGLGNYRISVLDYDLDPVADKYGNPSAVHNMYLHIASELGLPAFGLFIWVSILIFRQGIIALASADKHKSLFAIGMLAGLVGIYFYGMFEDVFFGSSIFMLISAMGGSLMAISSPVNQNRL